MTGAWAGNEWMGASAEPCDHAVASPVRWARQTSACPRASSGGRRTCCSRFPLYAPWTCSSGCTSPVIRARSTNRLMWRSYAWPPGLLGRGPTSQSIRRALAVKYIPGVCTRLLDFYEVSCTNKVETLQSTPQGHTYADLLEVNMQSGEVKGPLSGQQCSWHKWNNNTTQQQQRIMRREGLEMILAFLLLIYESYQLPLDHVRFTCNYHACF